MRKENSRPIKVKFIAPNKLLIPAKCSPNIAKSILGPL